MMTTGVPWHDRARVSVRAHLFWKYNTISVFQELLLKNHDSLFKNGRFILAIIIIDLIIGTGRRTSQRLSRKWPTSPGTPRSRRSVLHSNKDSARENEEILRADKMTIFGATILGRPDAPAVFRAADIDRRRHHGKIWFRIEMFGFLCWNVSICIENVGLSFWKTILENVGFCRTWTGQKTGEGP